MYLFCKQNFSALMFEQMYANPSTQIGHRVNKKFRRLVHICCLSLAISAMSMAKFDSCMKGRATIMITKG